MAILNYGNQFRYSGSGYVDSKMAPVETIDGLEKNVSVLISEYTPGMKVTVINDGEFGAMDYVLNGDYEWKRVIDLDSLTLSFDKGNYDADPETEHYLQLHYTNSNGELVALGEALDLSVLLEDIEARVKALEDKEGDDIVDTNTYVENVELVTEKDDELGLFMKFTYNNGESFYSNITELMPETYSQGVGILIGEDNVVSIDEEWFEQWFNEKVVELNERMASFEDELSEVKTNVASLSERLNAISGRVDGHDSEITVIKENLSSALTQIAKNKTTIETVQAQAEENKSNIVSLAERLAKIRGVEFIKPGDNIIISTNENGDVVISAVVDMSNVESRLDSVEGTVSTHTTEIKILQDKVKNLSPDGEAVAGDNETIETNENGLLSVKISNKDNNIIKKDTDGLYAQGLEMILGDDDINEYENN